MTNSAVLSDLQDIELSIITYLSVHGPTEVTSLNWRVMGKEPDLYGRFASVLTKLQREGVIIADDNDYVYLTNSLTHPTLDSNKGPEV